MSWGGREKGKGCHLPRFSSVIGQETAKPALQMSTSRALVNEAKKKDVKPFKTAKQVIF